MSHQTYKSYYNPDNSGFTISGNLLTIVCYKDENNSEFDQSKYSITFSNIPLIDLLTMEGVKELAHRCTCIEYKPNTMSNGVVELLIMAIFSYFGEAPLGAIFESGNYFQIDIPANGNPNFQFVDFSVDDIDCDFLQNSALYKDIVFVPDSKLVGNPDDEVNDRSQELCEYLFAVASSEGSLDPFTILKNLGLFNSN